MHRGHILESIAAYRKLQLNEYQLTYMAYEFMHQKPAKLKEAEGILQLANERYANSGIVQARWGDLYIMQGKTAEAISAYQQALKDNPEDKEFERYYDTSYARHCVRQFFFERAPQAHARPRSATEHET